MPVVVVVHRLKNFDEWFKLFKADPHQKLAVGGFCVEARTTTECTLSGRWLHRKLRP
jgi:hypothetical protein